MVGVYTVWGGEVNLLEKEDNIKTNKNGVVKPRFFYMNLERVIVL